MSEKGTNKKRLMEGIDIIVDEAKAAARDAIHRSGADTLGETLKEAIQGALTARDSVVMVRLNKESLARLDELVESGVVSSRSEASAFLIAEGVKSRSELFDRIASKIDQIRTAKAELRELLEEPTGEAEAADVEEPAQDKGPDRQE